jgi:protein-S-isoprenylcysteine O-methyltransferase Ste14
MVDLMELHRDLVEARRQHRPARSMRIKGVLFALIAILGFFLLGCLIAALSVPMWTKAVLFTLIAVLALIPSYIVAALLH